MKTMNMIGLFTVITLAAISSFVINVSAQKQGDALPKCRATADQIYFVASGQSVIEVRPR